MAECHPVGFQWVMEAKARGATVIHVDPRFTRTSAVADIHVGIRVGTDIAFLGGLINHVLSNELWFKEYVTAFTNAALLVSEDFQDTEELDGLFSGWNETTRTYDPASWQYEGADVGSASGDRQSPRPGEGGVAHRSQAGQEDSDPSGQEPTQAEKQAIDEPRQDLLGVHGSQPERDDTLQNPRCVINVLRRHYARYTPEMVEQVCGIPPEQFRKVADALTENSGRERTGAFCYAVGWTHHTTGAQYIRTAAILQLLLGNMGRPGGGILALRGHASIQGSTDIPTLYNLLPGYMPMPQARPELTLQSFLEANGTPTGFWGHMDAYFISLLKAWWGDAATAENDYCFDYIPRLTGDHGTYTTVMDQIDGKVSGYFLLGQNPAVGSANAKLQRLGLANLDWLVVRDFSLIESAMFWKDGPEIETGELETEKIPTEVFFMPAASHVEKEGTFTNTQRLLQWHHKAVEPQGDQRSELWFYYHLGRIMRERLAGSTDPRDRPLLDLTWNYSTEGPLDEPSGEEVLQEINGFGPKGPLSSYTEMKADGSTSAGCWIYTGIYADGVNQSARRKPGQEQSWVAPEWGWAWPANRRTLYNRASADPEGKPWSERKAYVWWDADAADGEGQWTGHDIPDFVANRRPDYEPAPDAKAEDAISGSSPFIMQADGKGWLFAPTGLVDGPMPTHYEPHESPFRNPLYGQQSNPARETFSRKDNLSNPGGQEPGTEVFPYVWTTYRLTEHHTAGGMSRWVPYLAELQPEMFCEVSPEMARQAGLTHGGWATIVTARTAIEARVLVTDRLGPLRVADKIVHQVGLPYHWGPNGLSKGDAANELLSVQLDPNVHIQDSKAGTCDVIPGRRPRGPELLRFVEEYRSRAGVHATTGTLR
ncbi:MAG: formate dehydrogenase major subunit [Frankiaceae bacterium]|nr:formate dehydrogenase major subunit [Frankiaceae bacterium]